MDEWHTIIISRTGREGTLQVDDEPIISALSSGAFTQLSLSLNLFIGGVPDVKDVAHDMAVNGMFVGCIQKVVINNRQLQLMAEALSGANVVDCQHQCSHHPCLNGGHCEPILESYACHCQSKFYGQNCEKGSTLKFILFS